VDSDEDRDRSRRPGVEDREWSSTGQVLGSRMIGRSSDAVCCLYRAQGDEEREFLGCGSKSRSMGFPVWGSKSVAPI
jgi:hypothetical protein